MSELKPCPFCWFDAPLLTFRPEIGYLIDCVSCGASGATRVTPELAAAAWNRRAEAEPTLLESAGKEDRGE